MPSTARLVEPNPIFFGGAADLAAPTCPKPSLVTPMPSLSTSLALFSRLCVDPNPPARPGLIGVGLAILVSSCTALVVTGIASVSSSGLYPSFAIRSASSRAFFSASSKSSPVSAVTFFAPSFVFFAPKMLVFRAPAPAAAVFLIAVEGTARGAEVGPDSEPLRGDFGRPVPLEPAVRKGEAVRLPTGGVAVLEGGLLGRLIVGLSQDEKKSSCGSPEGVCAPEAAESSISLIITSLGYLFVVSRVQRHTKQPMAHSFWSAVTRLPSSSLYFVAALEVYLVFGSLLFRAADPPCDWKYLVADSLPPTFIIRS
jgi:hypothetical protein